jgi:hypothetical protein
MRRTPERGISWGMAPSLMMNIDECAFHGEAHGLRTLSSGGASRAYDGVGLGDLFPDYRLDVDRAEGKVVDHLSEPLSSSCASFFPMLCLDGGTVERCAVVQSSVIYACWKESESTSEPPYSAGCRRSSTLGL